MHIAILVTMVVLFIITWALIIGTSTQEINSIERILRILESMNKLLANDLDRPRKGLAGVDFASDREDSMVFAFTTKDDARRFGGVADETIGRKCGATEAGVIGGGSLLRPFNANQRIAALEKYLGVEFTVEDTHVEAYKKTNNKK